MAKRVYLFDEGGRRDNDLLGGKGANLCEMTSLGLPVPYGFIITTGTCRDFFESGNQLPAQLESEYAAAVKLVEERMGAEFGNADNPLLFSVRSGAPISMPGMMNTILNLGLNDEIAEGWHARPATRGLPTTPTAASSRCSPTWCSAWTASASSTSSTEYKPPTASAGYGHDAEDWQAVIADVYKASRSFRRTPSSS